jgi:ribosomal protein S2
MNLPVIALMNTDCNVKQVEYPIIANDASVSCISFFVRSIKEAYAKGMSGK